MLKINREGIILNKTLLGFESKGVLNPALIANDTGIHMFYRAVSLENYSTIGYCKLSSPLTIESRMEVPVIFPQDEYESQGVEDPRLVKIDEIYYLTYTAYNGINALGALATSTDLLKFEKQGIIAPQLTFNEFQKLAAAKENINEKYIRFNEHSLKNKLLPETVLLWDKNIIFFPERINGKLYFMHRIRPDIQIVCIDKISDLTREFWQHYFLNLDCHIMLTAKFAHEVSYIGGGCPPIKTEAGWLVIYHAVHDTIEGYVYAACAALFDMDDPQKELSRLPLPLFVPEMPWEKTGVVNNVCFPTASLLENDTLYIYYGAADEQIAAVSLSISELLTELKTYSNQ